MNIFCIICEGCICISLLFKNNHYQINVYPTISLGNLKLTSVKSPSLYIIPSTPYRITILIPSTSQILSPLPQTIEFISKKTLQYRAINSE